MISLQLAGRLLLAVFLLFFARCSSPSAEEKWLTPGDIIRDTDSLPVNAHGGGMLYHEGIYYWYGEIKKGKTWRVDYIKDWEDYRVNAGGVACYSSKDLYHWKNEGVALAPNVDDSSSDLHTTKVIERPKVIYNPKTKQFVMWMHIDKEDYSYSQSGVAVSDSPAGPFRYLGSVKPNGNMSRDMTLFKDRDDRAYLVFSSEFNKTMHICLLSEDYLRPSQTEKRILIGDEREAPALFFQKGKYYLITSGCTGWNPNPASYAVADSMLGDWKTIGDPCIGDGAETTFQSQSAYVAPIAGNDTALLFMADRWNKTDLEASGYVWLPISVDNNGALRIAWRNKWLLP